MNAAAGAGRDAAFMREALAQAQLARVAGEVPVTACIVTGVLVDVEVVTTVSVGARGPIAVSTTVPV